MDIENKAWQDAIKEITEKLANNTSNLQTIHTPFELVNCMIGKLKENVELKDKTFCVFNLEFVEALIYDYGVARDRIWFVTDCPEKAKIMGHDRYKGVVVARGNFLKTEMIMKFDCVIMNPPYQAKTKGGNGQRDLWPDFVKKGLSICKENGFCVFVHPNKWRRTEYKLWEILSKKQIKYLEIHDDQDGRKIFGATTRYDWYILQNSKCNNKSVVVDENEKVHKLDLNKLPCLPNYNFDDFWSVMAKDGEETLDVIYSSSIYDARKPNMSKEKSNEFKYPCVYGMYQDGTFSCFYSNEKSGHFTPKVILGIGRHLYPLIDIKGEYGMTQNAFGIKVSSLKEAENIKKAIESNRFKEIIKATKWSNFQTDWRMFKYFRKDFWKEFIDEK
jgi:hypothetical protein